MANRVDCLCDAGMHAQSFAFLALIDLIEPTEAATKLTIRISIGARVAIMLHIFLDSNIWLYWPKTKLANLLGLGGNYSEYQVCFACISLCDVWNFGR